MKVKWQSFYQNETVRMIAKTIFYILIILILIYLYSYSRTGGAHFIYNEF